MTENNLLEVLAPVGDMERLYAALDFGEIGRAHV